MSDFTLLWLGIGAQFVVLCLAIEIHDRLAIRAAHHAWFHRRMGGAITKGV